MDLLTKRSFTALLALVAAWPWAAPQLLRPQVSGPDAQSEVAALCLSDAPVFYLATLPGDRKPLSRTDRIDSFSAAAFEHFATPNAPMLHSGAATLPRLHPWLGASCAQLCRFLI